MSAQNGHTRLSAIIVDDELYGRENLTTIINTYCNEIEVVATADSVIHAVELVKIHTPDVVFLDINMPVLDGFDFLNEYEERTFMVVFFTAHNEYGIQAVKSGAVDYLLKPVNIKELKQCVRKLVLLKNQKILPDPVQVTDKLVLPASHGFEVLEFDNILRMEGDGCYTKVFLADNSTKMISHTLKHFEDALPQEKFYRIHKSHLINIKYVKSYSNISGLYVTMTDGSVIEISRRKAPDFIQKIKSSLKTI